MTRKRSLFNYLWVTLLSAFLLAIFLSPFVYMIFTSLKTGEQISVLGSPLWPAAPGTFEYEGKVLEMFSVPLPDGSIKDMAMFKPGRSVSLFIDPDNPDAGAIEWEGNWRGLERPWQFSPAWSNYADAWNSINFPRLLANTTMYAIISNIGVLISCVLVAYGFSRFEYPGRDFLFIVLISTIFLPGTVTVIPTYTFFALIGWVGSWLPLLVPTFFANAYDTFLLRQYFMTLPKALDEAAMIDGAGPFRVLWSVILPQSYPALMAITVFHIVYAWNDYFGPLIYLSAAREKWPVSIALSTFNGIYGSRPELIQAASLMTLLLPLLLFLAAQRFFIQGIVITGVEK
ncbi:MAG TPA: carbohydrate ABC transporter permease [Chloroflexi bacterium]|nr:carbohydrate ABC transporter permease [Chloroflexota bacterium]